MITKPFDIRGVVLHPLIEAICESTPSEHDILPLIRLSVQFSLGYLRYKCACGYRITEIYPYQENDLEQIAVDAIADLFERDHRGDWIRLRTYFQPLLTLNPDPEEWTSLIRKLVTSRTRQYLFQVFRDRDPVSARLYRGIKRVAAASRQLNIEETGRGLFLTGRNSSGAVRIPDPLLTDSLSQDLYAVFKPSDTLPVLVDKFTAVCQERLGYLPRMPVMELVKIIKNYRSHFQNPPSQPSAAPEDGILESEIEQQVEKTYSRLCDKIDRDYIRSGKIDASLGETLKNALALLIHDILAGNAPRPYLDYIQAGRPDMTSAIYQREIRTRFEYFVRLMKKAIKDFLISDSAA